MLWAIFSLILAGTAFYGAKQFRSRGTSWGLPLSLSAASLSVLCLLIAGIAIMAISVIVIGIIVGLTAQYKHHLSWGRPLAGACAGLLMFISVGKILVQASGCERHGHHADQRELAEDLRQLRAWHAGHFLAEHQPQAVVLVLYDRDDETAHSQLRAFRKGADKKLNLLDPQPVGTETDSVEGLVHLFQTHELDTLLRNWPQAQIIVSFAGLPADLPDSEWDWQREALPAFFLIGQGRHATRDLVRDRRILGIIYRRPDLPHDLRSTDDFERTHIILTADNLQQAEDLGIQLP